MLNYQRVFCPIQPSSPCLKNKKKRALHVWEIQRRRPHSWFSLGSPCPALPFKSRLATFPRWSKMIQDGSQMDQISRHFLLPRCEVKASQHKHGKSAWGEIQEETDLAGSLVFCPRPNKHQQPSTTINNQIRWLQWWLWALQKQQKWLDVWHGLDLNEELWQVRWVFPKTVLQHFKRSYSGRFWILTSKKPPDDNLQE